MIPERYRTDCQEIVTTCLRRGLVISLNDAYVAWGNYSEAYAAGWLGLPCPFDNHDDFFVTQEECDIDIERTVKFYLQKNDKN